jgi:hypothetical protein
MASAPFVPPRLGRRAPKPLWARASKQALFAVYLTTLSLATTPHARTGGAPSSLHGLAVGRGRAHCAPRRPVWAVGPLWGAWAAWFDALVCVFAAGARCHVAGAPHLALAGRGLEWASGGGPAVGPRFRALEAASPVALRTVEPQQPHFWLVLTAHRGVGETRAPAGAPVFTIGGLHMRPQAGWRVLPGPLGCPRLAAFALSSALAAYQVALQGRV